VSDVCDALMAAETSLYTMPEGHYDAFNVCTGNAVSNKQLAEKFIENYPLQYDFKEIRLGDPGYLIGNPSKLSSIWKTGPQYQIDDIIKTHYNYALYANERK
jgi:UDP-glucose 4-epimerase